MTSSISITVLSAQPMGNVSQDDSELDSISLASDICGYGRTSLLYDVTADTSTPYPNRLFQWFCSLVNISDHEYLSVLVSVRLDMEYQPRAEWILDLMLEKNQNLGVHSGDLRVIYRSPLNTVANQLENPEALSQLEKATVAIVSDEISSSAKYNPALICTNTDGLNPAAMA